MTRLKKDNLALGMRFSAPIFFEDGKNMFLAEKKPVLKFHLDSLLNWNIPEVITHGSLLPEDYVEEEEELLEELTDFDSFIEEEDKERISSTIDQYVFSKLSLKDNPSYITYENLIEKIMYLFAKLTKRQLDGITTEIDTIINDIKALIEKDSNTILSFILLGENAMTRLEKSAINTTILTYVIAKKLGSNANEIHQYMIGALLHDIGMTQLSKDLLNKTSSLTDDEFSKIKLHTVNGYLFFTESLHYPKELALIALHHHERTDGTGYPSAKQGADIPRGAAIVAVADTFEAMVSHRPYRNSMLGSEVMKFLIANCGRYHEPYIVRAFVQSMGIFPVGSIVLLNTGQFARVIEANPTVPLRPKVRILADNNADSADNPDGIPIPPELQKKIFIVRSVDPKDIPDASK